MCVKFKCLQDFKPWTVSSGLVDAEGLGPLASEVAAAYSRLQEVPLPCQLILKLKSLWEGDSRFAACSRSDFSCQLCRLMTHAY